MEKESKKSVAGKFARWSLLVVALAGGVLLSNIADLSDKNGAMSRIFVFFLGTIIVVQIIPAVMLLGAMCKGVFSLVKKEKEHFAHHR